MISDPDIREQAYQYFLEEAPALLESIETGLFALNDTDENRKIKVNEIMRAAHTLKGGAANVGLETIKSVAHSLEDILKALYNPEVLIDGEIKKLLFESYECLRLPMTAELTQATIDENEIKNKATEIFEQLKNKLGDFLNEQEDLLSSEELGLDVTKSFFEVVIPEQLTEITAVLATKNTEKVAQVLRAKAEVFIGIGESLNLPGFKAIATTTITALNNNPDAAITIAQTALNDIQTAKEAVLKGDTDTDGGHPSATLLQLAATQEEDNLAFLEENFGQKIITIDFEEELNTETVLKTDLEKFQEFLENDQTLKTKQFYINTVKCILGWFHRHQEIPLSQLNLTKLINIPETEENPEKYLDNLLYEFLQFIKSEKDTPSLRLYRYWTTLEVINAVVKFTSTKNLEKFLQQKREQIYHAYQKYPPVSQTEENWLEEIKPQELIKIIDHEYYPELIKETQALAIQPEIVEDEINFQEDVTVIETKITESEDQDFYKRKKGKEKGKIAQTVRVSLTGLEELNHQVGELLISQNKNSLQDAQIQTAIQDLIQKLEKNQQILNLLKENYEDSLTFSETKEENQGIEQQEQTSLLKLALTGITESITVAEKVKGLTSESSQTLKRQQRMLFHMRDELIDLRMAPIGNILNRFAPMIEQLKSAHNKQVELKLSGHHILVDKAIAEKLYDPLLHLVRNAFDHGIETPENRAKLGKPETGKIEIRAYHQGGKTIIEVRDDGQGLNFERIKEKAVKNKLVSAQMVNQIPESELLGFLFQPGFSTANQVSELSGRGVGLDVVRTQLEALKGSIAIESRQKEGTTFSLQIPLTLSIAKLMVVEAEKIIYALLPDVIEKIIVPKPEEIQIFEGQKVLHWRGENNSFTVPVRKLSKLLNYSRSVSGNTEENEIQLPILLLRRQKGLLGLEVNHVLGEQELVIRPLGSALAPPSYVYGCSVLSDSRLTLVIDATGLAEKTQERTTYQTQAVNPKHLPSKRQLELLPESREYLANQNKILLVVDDSLSLRQSLSLILEKAGYKVIQAEDGMDGIDKLQHSEVDLIICDLEMPRMNGFEFLKTIRKQPDLSQAPIAMLTSRGNQQYRQLAKQLGAADYWTKPYGEKELLSAITDLFAHHSS